MKIKMLAVALSLLVCASTSAQKNKKEATDPPPQLPLNSSQKISYDDVVDVKGKNADELYRKILDWYLSYYKNPREVIRENDPLEKSVTGKPRFRIYNPPDKEGTKTDAGLVQYTITIAAKDGRFKYTISDFNWKGNSYYACEKWYDTNLSSHNSKMYEYLKQLDNYSKTIIRDLMNFIENAETIKVSRFEIPVSGKGVKEIPVKINGLLAIDFILDTGADETTVTADVVSTMLRQKLITFDDFLEGKEFILADGSVVRSQRFLIKQLEIGNIKFTNVEASISPASASPLLGQNVLSGFKSIQQDNARGVVIFELR
jgi:predicted aspartyl protease